MGLALLTQSLGLASRMAVAAGVPGRVLQVLVALAVVVLVLLAGQVLRVLLIRVVVVALVLRSLMVVALAAAVL